MQQNHKKKRVIFFLICLVCIGVLSALGIFLFARCENENTDDGVYLYPDSYFFTPDYQFDILTDETYLAKNRTVYYSDGVLERPASDIGTTKANFWLAYFETLVQGDTEAYLAMHTDAYLARMGEISDFTMQRVYNICVEERAPIFQNSDRPEEATLVFSVSYCILKNDGTFRRDFFDDGRDSIAEQLITLVEVDGVYKINSVTRVYYK